ncbi:AlpA family phage regulatory protein [Methylomonas sp. OY6]|uniref:AlpA family phage regulatory protein n=1 Tax=Methylomonas defluvii TaxID=3045149 RepID=A0ABU4UEV8_9GAMM|nr:MULTISPECIES: AlpA family phage regulatory protein [unclassified Methylomonas]MDX8127988.1 AlpA family phage regulatory protein [Methylomonas sp. OY6]
MASKPSPHRMAAVALGYLRVWHITGDEKRGIDPLLPIGRSTFLARVASGEYPQPIKLGKRTTAWRKSDILALLESFDLAIDVEAA